MNIFFDFDGTLLDSRLRLYRLFQFLVPASKLSFEEYWNIKRNGRGHREILSTDFHFSGSEISKFEDEWMKLIEAGEWLMFDKPHDGVTDFLRRISPKNDLYIVTNRQFPEPVYNQINTFGWQDLFKHIFITRQKIEKLELIKENKNIKVSPDDLFIGDSGLDIKTGRELGIKTIAVLNGFLNEKMILKYNPDLIVDSVTKIKV